MPIPEKTSLLSVTAKEVLLLFDWENFFYSLYYFFGPDNMHIEDKLKRVVEWVKKDIGELLGGHGFVFAPEHLTYLHQQICVRNRLRLMICPKRPLSKPKRNTKTGNMEMEEDTVDETIIWFAKIMIRHPNFKFVCLVAGDNDYVPLFKELGRRGIKRALVAPTRDSLAKTKELIELVDKHPTTLKKMSLRLDDM